MRKAMAFLLLFALGVCVGSLLRQARGEYIPIEPTMPFPPYYFAGPCGGVVETPGAAPPWGSEWGQPWE
jgi:hypothetical protein